MAQFEIVELTPAGIVPLPHLGIFSDGKQAAAACNFQLSFNPARKFQPRPLREAAVDWRERELDRNTNGSRQPLPWDDLPPIPDHFAFRSNKVAEGIAYTPSPEHGEKDRQIAIHVNTYLHRFYPDLDVDTRRQLVWKFTGHDPSDNLRFAYSADDIEKVYNNGPSSCMNGEGYVETSDHPVRAYAGPDLAVAYLGDLDDVTARTVVWPDKKLYVRIYGDSHQLAQALEAKGYRKAKYGEFEGARLSLTYSSCYSEDAEDDIDGVLCPYIDFAFAARISDDNHYLVIDRKGDYAVRHTIGLATRDYLEHCGCCHESRLASAFKDTGYWQGKSNKYVCEDCAFKLMPQCAVSGDLLFIPDYQSSSIRTLADGRVVHRQYDNQTFTCPVTNELHLKDEGVFSGGTYYSKEGFALKDQAA